MRATFLVIALTAFLSAATQAGDQQSRCEVLATTVVPDTQASEASFVTDHKNLPAFCDISGTIADRIGFAMRLPASDWNGKFVVAGCGGFCGSVLPDKRGFSNSINEALKLGYAAITTDGGHQDESWSTDWALRDPPALELYAGGWMPKAVATGRALLKSFYADTARRTYFSGCSNGGRLGMMAAQRYPELFDGIAAGGGIFDLTGQAGIHGLWLLQSTRDKNGKAVIDRNKLPLLGQHVMAQCDDLDGVNDGVISRPELCHPQIDSLQCQDEVSSSCFSAPEIVAIKRLYQGATVNGEQLYPGIPPGSEALWPIWVTGTDDAAAWGERAAEGNLRLTYGLRGSDPFNPHDYELAQELENLQRLAPTLNATDPDLRALAKSGNKLFYYHGLADPLILEGRVRQYHAQASALMGREELDSVARFMMVPGHGHCWERPGRVADHFNPLVIIDQWVESGKAPDYVLAVQNDAAGKVLRSRRLCPYPQVAEFQGGNQDQTDSFGSVSV